MKYLNSVTMFLWWTNIYVLQTMPLTYGGKITSRSESYLYLLHMLCKESCHLDVWAYYVKRQLLAWYIYNVPLKLRNAYVLEFYLWSVKYLYYYQYIWLLTNQCISKPCTVIANNDLNFIKLSYWVLMIALIHGKTFLYQYTKPVLNNSSLMFPQQQVSLLI